jgi:dolichol kinase
VVDRRRLIRRGFHSLSSLFIIYYWLPDYIEPLQLTRQQVALLGIFLLAVFEAYRIRQGWLFFGLRDYERKWIAGYFWGAFGYVIALLLFDERFAMLTILGTTIGDPVLGELRGTPWKKWAPVGGFTVWCSIAVIGVALVPLSTPLLFIPLGAALAVGVESIRVKWVDDNFLMNIVPLLALTGLAAITGL